MGNFVSENAAPSYFINGLTSNFDFWNVDRHEWKEQDVLMGFLERIFSRRLGHFGPQNGASS